MNIKARERRLIAEGMRRNGATLREIGKALGVSVARAKQLSEWQSSLEVRVRRKKIERALADCHAMLVTLSSRGTLDRAIAKMNWQEVGKDFEKVRFSAS